MTPAGVQARWATLIVRELVRLGVDRFAVAPGSRSTPLVLAIAAHPQARAVVVSDERDAAFWALGCAKGAGRPAALVTTSGSAATHALPAVVEASAAEVPLLVLSADRPPELHGAGANQTMDQRDLFGAHVRDAVHLPAPDPAIDPAWLLATVDQAVRRATRAPAGPVHVNLPFRKPLEPAPWVLPRQLGEWEQGSAPWTTWRQGRAGLAPEDAASLAALVGGAERGLLAVGALSDPEERRAARSLAARLGWPVLADAASGVAGTPHLDRLLGAPVVRAALAPDVVLQLGGRRVSTRLEEWLADSLHPVTWIQVGEGPGRIDPAHRLTHRYEVPAGALDALPLAPRRHPALAGLAEAAAAAEDAVARLLADAPGLPEPAAARWLAARVPEDEAIYVASSMPARDVDRYRSPRERPARVASSRGVSGIDGMLATAAGYAAGCGRPVTLLVGDQAFFHDVGGLALLADADPPVVAVVLDNGGGGIFGFLPVAGAAPEVHERFFAAPAARDIGAACAAFGVPCDRVASEADLARAWRQRRAAGRSAVLVVPGERAANKALHDRLDAAIAAAGEGALGRTLFTSRTGGTR